MWNLQCLSSLSTGLRVVATCDMLEQRDRVELDLDMLEVDTESWQLDTVLFLSNSGVEPGVVRSDRSELDTENPFDTGE